MIMKPDGGPLARACCLCDVTWWLKARREHLKRRTREARDDEEDLAVVDDLRVVAEDLRAPRLNVSWGAGQKERRGSVP